MHSYGQHPKHTSILVVLFTTLLALAFASSECYTSCLPGTYLQNDSCQACPSGHYCEDACSAPSQCPVGTYNEYGYQFSEKSCFTCESGTYSTIMGATACQTCPDGYYCPSATMNPVLCPPGHYCLGGVSAPVPCPSGSYSALAGQSSCVGCGATSTSSAGSTACSCVGSNRIHMTDGACRCKPGFTSFITGLSTPASADADERSPCEPIHIMPCAEPLLRNATGHCTDPSDPMLCEASCGHIEVHMDARDERRLTSAAVSQLKASVRGYFDHSLRMCVCASPSQQDMCPYGDCGSASTLSMSKSNANGLKLTLTDPLSAQFTSTSFSQLPSLFAPTLACPRGDCPVHAITVKPKSSHVHVGVSANLADIMGADVERLSTSSTHSILASTAISKMTPSELDSRLHRLVSVSVDDTHVAQPMAMQGVQPASTILPAPKTANMLLSFPSAGSPSLTHAALCLPLGGTVLWHLDGGYPVFQASHTLTTAALDYSPFLRLQQRLNAGVVTENFAHTFTQAGSFMFTDSTGATSTLISVMPLGVACPAKFTTAATLDTSSAIALDAITFMSTALDPDLDIVYILIIVFIGVSLLLAVFAKLTQYQARRARILFEMPDDTIARQNFRKLQQDIQQQQNDHKVLFQSQIENFRAECDRIAAETEQVKALLSVKITDSAGFLRAARNLIMAESTARQSFEHSQGSLERRAMRLMQDLSSSVKQQLLAAVNVVPGAAMPRANENMCLIAADLASKISELVQNSSRERLRREMLVRNSGIIGEELVNVMNQKEDRLYSLEGTLISRLNEFREQYLEPKLNEIITLDTKFATRSGELRKQRNFAIVKSVVLGFKMQIDDLARAMIAPLQGDDSAVDVGVTEMQLEPLVSELTTLRLAANNDTEQALLAVRKMITAATTKQKLAVFMGVPPELERALRLFLCQAGAAILGDNMIMGDIGLANEDQKSRREDIHHMDALQSLMFDTMAEQDNRTLTGDIDNDIEILLSKINDHSISSDDLKSLYGTFMKKKDTMEKIISEQKEHALNQAQDMLAMEITNNEDRAALEKATSLLKTVMAQHEKEKQALTARLNAEQERDMEREIEEQTARAAAENARYEEERIRLERELEEKRRNMVSGSDEEHASIAEHVLKLKRLDETKKDDNNKYQQNLRDKHAQWKLKRQREMDALKLKQKAELKDREKEYNDTVSEIKERDAANNTAVAGVDIAALAARIDGIGMSGLGSGADSGLGLDDDDDLVDDEETRLEKKKFLEELALQKKQELQREHEDARRRLDMEMERERQDQMRSFEDEAQRKREAALARLEEVQRNLQQVVDDPNSNDDEATRDEGRRLLEKYEREKNELQKQMENEESAQRSKLDAALRARASQKQKLLAARQDNEKGEAEQSRQDFEKNLILREKKQKEEEILAHVIQDKGIDKSSGATVIENVMAERQKKELVELMKQQRAEASRRTKEMLDNAYSDLFEQQQSIKAAKEGGMINADQEKAELARLEGGMDIELLKAKIEGEIQAKHDRELKEAREQYTKEIQGMYNKLYGDDAGELEVHRWEDKKELERRLKEAEERKRAEEEEIRRKQEEVEAEIARMKEDAEKQRQVQLQEEMSKVEEQMRRDRAQMEKRLAEQEEKARVERERALADREKQLQEEQGAALDEAEREAILKRYNEEIEARLVQDELEKKRQSVELQNRLKAREEQRKTLAAKRAQDRARRKMEESEAWVQAEDAAAQLRQQEASLSQRTKEAKQQVLWKLVKAGKLHAACHKLGCEGVSRVLQHTSDAERARIVAVAQDKGQGNILTGLQQQQLPEPVLQAVLATLPASTKLQIGDAAGAGASSVAVSSVLDGLESMLAGVVGASKPASLDAAEDTLAQQHGDDSLHAVSVSTLELREFLALRFAQWAMDIAADTLHMPTVTLLPAEQLPAPPQHLHACAYKHSIHYRPATRVVYLHRLRLQDVGPLTVVVSACAAHVSANAWAPTNSGFISAYAQVQSALMRQLFCARSYSSHTDVAVIGSAKTSTTASIGTGLNTGSAVLVSNQTGEEQYSYVSSSHWRAAEGQWRALTHTLATGQTQDGASSLTPAVSVRVKEDVVGDYLDLTGTGADAHSMSTAALCARLDSYRAFRETQQLRAEVLRVEAAVRANTRGQDAALAQARDSDVRVGLDGSEDDDEHGTGDIAVLCSRVERLRCEADRLTIELVEVVSKTNDATIAHTQQQDQKQGDPAHAALRDVLRRLLTARMALVQRLRDIERQTEALNALISAARGDKPVAATEEEKE